MKDYLKCAPSSVSLEDVTKYLRELIEVSEQESKRLLPYAKEEIKKHTQAITKEVSAGTHNGRIESSEYVLRWRYVQTGARSAEAVPEGIHMLEEHSDSYFLIEWLKGGLSVVDWKLPQFLLDLKRNPAYPQISIPNSNEGIYEIKFYSGLLFLNNERFPASLLYDYDNDRILEASYSLHSKEKATFWDIYDLSAPQDKKLLLRDWLPLEEITS